MLNRLRRRHHIQEAAAVIEAIRGDLVPVNERAVRRDGTLPIRLISPGWGASGYYSGEVLERAGTDRIFPAGTHMYWDHPTLSERSERPERSLRDLAAVLETDAIWQADHPDGPGLYAEVGVFGPYRDTLDEMAAHIGVSIRAAAEMGRGEADGRRGPVVERIVEGQSVDFVTRPGRGGQVMAILESAGHSEEAMADDVRMWLRSELMDRFGGDDSYVWVRDYDPDAGTVIFDLEGDSVDDPGTYQLAYTRTDDAVELADDEPTEVRVSTTYEPVGEARNVAEWLQSRIHLHFTSLTDDMFGEGRITKPERIALSSGIGAALDAFSEVVDDKAPDLLTRDLWDEPSPAEQDIDESEEDEMKPEEIREAMAEVIKPLTDRIEALESSGEQSETETVEEANTRAERAEEALLVREAADHIAANDKVKALPEITAKRVVEAVSKGAKRTDDGKLNVTALDEAVATAVKAEVEYLAEATGSPVRDTGGEPPDGPTDVTESTERLAAAFARLGMTEETAKVAATGRS